MPNIVKLFKSKNEEGMNPMQREEIQIFGMTPQEYKIIESDEKL